MQSLDRDVRLKEGHNLGADYLDELRERIRDIRAPEKRCYRKITEIYALYMADWKAKLDGFLQFK
jgi:hypothetical protein